MTARLAEAAHLAAEALAPAPSFCEDPHAAGDDEAGDDSNDLRK